MIPIPEILPRPTEIHRRPCRLCPTAHCPPDEENLDVKSWYEAGESTFEEACFPCG